MIRISVIVPTFNRADIFLECIQSIVNSIGANDEIIVINDSKTNSIQLDFEHDQLRIFDNPKNGVASARNLGAAHSNGEYLLFVDDDMIVNSAAIESCYELILKNPDSAVNSDWIYPSAELKKIVKTSFGRYLEKIRFTTLEGWCSDLTWIKNGLVKASGISSQFLLMSKKTFLATPGYHESFPFAGFEDYDFGKRLEIIHTNFIINTRSLVYHNERDRMELQPFLDRKKRGAYTRKKGVESGYTELTIPFSSLKKTYLKCRFLFKPLYIFLTTITPNTKFFDPIYHFLVNRLVGIAIYEGYSEKDI